MGLLDKLKIKDKGEGKEWLIDKKRGLVELQDSFIKMNVKFPKTEQILFYKDITHIERINNKVIILKTNTKEYRIVPVGFGEVSQKLSDDAYMKILEKISEYK